MGKLATSLTIVGVLATAFVAFALHQADSPEGKAKAKLRHGIELCWQEQQRKSLTPDVQRFIAGACEKMERDFEDRFHVRP